MASRLDAPLRCTKSPHQFIHKYDFRLRLLEPSGYLFSHASDFTFFNSCGSPFIVLERCDGAGN